MRYAVAAFVLLLAYGCRHSKHVASEPKTTVPSKADANSEIKAAEIKSFILKHSPINAGLGLGTWGKWDFEKNGSFLFKGMKGNFGLTASGTWESSPEGSIVLKGQSTLFAGHRKDVLNQFSRFSCTISTFRIERMTPDVAGAFIISKGAFPIFARAGSIQQH